MFYSSLSFVHRGNEGYIINMNSNSFKLNKNHTPNTNTNIKYTMMCQSNTTNLYYVHCTLRTQQHVHFVHSFIENVSVWDPTTHFNIPK